MKTIAVWTHDETASAVTSDDRASMSAPAFVHVVMTSSLDQVHVWLWSVLVSGRAEMTSVHEFVQTAWKRVRVGENDVFWTNVCLREVVGIRVSGVDFK